MVCYTSTFNFVVNMQGGKDILWYVVVPVCGTPQNLMPKYIFLKINTTTLLVVLENFSNIKRCPAASPKKQYSLPSEKQ